MEEEAFWKNGLKTAQTSKLAPMTFKITNETTKRKWVWKVSLLNFFLIRPERDSRSSRSRYIHTITALPSVPEVILKRNLFQYALKRKERSLKLNGELKTETYLTFSRRISVNYLIPCPESFSILFPRTNGERIQCMTNSIKIPNPVWNSNNKLINSSE